MLTDRSNTSPAGTPGDLRLTIIAGTFTIGAAGAITAQDSNKATGMNTVTKTAAKTGRYDLLTYRPWTRLVADFNIIGPADAAFGNTGANSTGVRNVVAGSAVSQLQVQGILASTGADTDFVSGTIVEYILYCYGK